MLFFNAAVARVREWHIFFARYCILASVCLTSPGTGRRYCTNWPFIIHLLGYSYRETIRIAGLGGAIGEGISTRGNCSDVRRATFFSVSSATRVYELCLSYAPYTIRTIRGALL